jgi:hypothetical protein
MPRKPKAARPAIQNNADAFDTEQTPPCKRCGTTCQPGNSMCDACEKRDGEIALAALASPLPLPEPPAPPAAATYDFGNGPVPAHRHVNPDGSRGGWVADSASVGDGASVGAWASVGDGASVGAWASVGAGASVGAWASVGAGASVGAWASVGAGASVITTNHCASGFLGSHHFTAWRHSGGAIWLQYGCVTMPLEDWHDQHDALADQHTGSTDHAKWTRAAAAIAALLPELPAEAKPEVPPPA